MLDGPFKAAMGITAYVLIVFVKACELGLGGAIILADVRAPAVVILCEPCGGVGAKTWSGSGRGSLISSGFQSLLGTERCLLASAAIRLASPANPSAPK
jgi:hypothetical protein